MTKRASSENKQPTGFNRNDNGGVKLMSKLDYSPGNLAESNDAHHRWVPGRGSSLVRGKEMKLKLQYCGHLMGTVNSLEKTLIPGKTEGRRRGRQRMRWLDGSLIQWT